MKLIDTIERDKLIKNLNQACEIMSVLSPMANRNEERERVNELFQEYDRLTPTPPLKFVFPTPDAAGYFQIHCAKCGKLTLLPRQAEVFYCFDCGTFATAIEMETEYETRTK